MKDNTCIHDYSIVILTYPAKYKCSKCGDVTDSQIKQFMRSTQEQYRKLCTEEGCYNVVKEDDIERNEEGRPYPRSQKCWGCRTSQDKAAIKKFRKKVKKINSLSDAGEHK